MGIGVYVTDGNVGSVGGHRNSSEVAAVAAVIRCKPALWSRIRYIAVSVSHSNKDSNEQTSIVSTQAAIAIDFSRIGVPIRSSDGGSVAGGAELERAAVEGPAHAAVANATSATDGECARHLTPPPKIKTFLSTSILVIITKS